METSTVELSVNPRAAFPATPTAPVVAKILENKVESKQVSGTSAPSAESVATGDLKEAPKLVEEPKESLTPRFAALARKEQLIVQDRQKLQSERQTLEAEKTQFASTKTAQAEEAAMWETKPLEVMKRHGWDYDKLTKLILNEGQPTPDMVARSTVKEEIDQWRKQQQEELHKQKAEAEKAARERHAQTIKEFIIDIDDFLKHADNTEAYELINLNEANETVLATIEEHYQRTSKPDENGKPGKPEVMSIKQACDLVEEYLLEKEIEKAQKSKKLSSRLIPQPDPAPKGSNGEPKPSPTPVQPRTITNAMTTSSASARPLTRDERIKRALALGKN